MTRIGTSWPLTRGWFGCSILSVSLCSFFFPLPPPPGVGLRDDLRLATEVTVWSLPLPLPCPGVDGPAEPPSARHTCIEACCIAFASLPFPGKKEVLLPT